MEESQPPQPQEPIGSPVEPEASEKQKPVFDPTGRVEQVNAYETKIDDIRRHPFGLMIIYLQVVLGLGLSFGLIFFLLPGVFDTLGLGGGGATSLVVVLGFFVMLLGLLFLFLVTRIYTANRLIVTDMHVTQVVQIGLFNRKVSELAMSNIEDVIAQQKGVFSTIFNYGTLMVETAGAEENFIFSYCPNPNAYAKAILDCRAEFLEKHSK